MKKKILILSNDSLESYDKVGYDPEERKRYFNPGKVFDEVFIFYPHTKIGYEFKYGMHAYKFGQPFFLKYFFLTLKALKLMREERIDVIRAYNPWRQGLIGAIVKKITGKPLVISLHNEYEKLARARKYPVWKRTILKLMENYAIRNADNVWCVSSALTEYAKKRGAKEENIKITPNKVDTKKFQVTKKDRGRFRKRLGITGFNILTVGRLSEEKNNLTLIKAVQDLKRSNVSLSVVGDGSLMPKLKEYVKKHKLDKIVKFHGFVPNKDLPKYYAAADVFVLPSLVEGFGIVLIEAQAAGKAIISSDIPETKDVVTADNALLFNPMNQTELEKKMLKLMKNSRLKGELENRSSRSAKNFEWKKLEERENKLYRKLMPHQR